MVLQTSRVPFSMDTVGKCLCPGCPVQGSSECVQDLNKNLDEAISREPLKKEDIPGAYCSAGNATCSGLDPSQPCQCGGCSVFGEYDLAKGNPVGYYCRDGKSRLK